jgi:glycosyltransferase involved in cell wall biosynthesis
MHNMTTFAFVCRAADPTQTLHVAQQAEALAIAGHQVDIFAPSWPALAREITQPRVRIRSLGAAPPAGAIGGGALLFWLYAWIAISLAQFQRRYHVIQVTGSSGIFVFVAWIAHLLGAKIAVDTDEALPERVMALSGASRESLRVRRAVLIEQLVVDFADHLIVTTEPLRGRYISRGCPPEKISVIYRMPDENRFSQSLTVARHAAVADRFLMVCREDRPQQMDLATVIRAVAALRERLPQAVLWIVCPPEERPALSALVRELDLKDAVLVQNALGEEELPSFIAQSDAYIVATPRDPLTDLQLPPEIFEGMALGVPTIAVRTQATQFYFDTNALLVYDQGDAADLANRIEWLAQQGDIRPAMKQHTVEMIAHMNWSRERHRYVALLLAIAIADFTAGRAPAEAAGFSLMSRRRSASIRALRAALATQGIDPSASDMFDQAMNGDQPAPGDSAALPLRLTPLSHEWRAGRQFRMRLGALQLRAAATALLFGIPVVASNSETFAKVITALMFAAVVGIMLLLPPGEAAIIVALYFVMQRWLFIHFPPEGILGHVIIYLGTALQLIIFAGFCLRAIIQQRPLLRSGFILWPASLYIVISVLSMWFNHVTPYVALLGTEHTLHNLIFVVLIAEDLPTPIQLRRYTGFILAALSFFATLSIVKTVFAFHVLGLHLPSSLTWFAATSVPVPIVEPDPNSYAYLINFGILLALAVFVSLNTEQNDFGEDSQTPTILNVALLGALGLLTIAEFLTASPENWVGLIAGVIALGVIFRGRLWYAIGGFLALLLGLSFVPFVAAPKQHAITMFARLQSIANGQLPHNAPLGKSLDLVLSHPLFGVGPGRFGGTVAFITHSPIYAQYGFAGTTPITSITLFWLHIAGETGLIGLGIFLWLIFLTERTIWQAYYKGAHRQWHGITAGVFGIVIAMSIATFFGNALEIDSLSAPFWGLVGIAVALPLANRPLITEVMPALRFRGAQEGAETAAAQADGNALTQTRGG